MGVVAVLASLLLVALGLVTAALVVTVPAMAVVGWSEIVADSRRQREGQKTDSSLRDR